MKTTINKQEKILHHLEHYLPSQSPLKDFVHHNTLHAFQHMPFHEAMKMASEVFGYTTYMSLDEFREKYRTRMISDAALDRAILARTDEGTLVEWRDRLIMKSYNTARRGKVGRLRALWKEHFKINLDKEVYPLLFRIAGNYLDQGVALWSLPENNKGLMATVRALEKHSTQSFFKSEKVRGLALNEHTELETLLQRIVGKETFFEQYLFDMQFAHPGWSGMVNVAEHAPGTLLLPRRISLRDFILLELLLELDVLERKLGADFEPLTEAYDIEPGKLLQKEEATELDTVYQIWQEAFENTYFDQVLTGVAGQKVNERTDRPRFQALFCIDDRESSLRTYVEMEEPAGTTFGTAGFFNLPVYFRPEDGQYRIKVCPNPIDPKHMIVEKHGKKRHRRETAFGGHHQSMFTGWFTAQTLGFWTALKMTKNIILPGKSPLMVSSFQHMDPDGILIYENEHHESEGGCQVGFAPDEMAERIEGLFRSIGLEDHFAPLIYFVGHGASSINNTYYAGYDCGACSGRPGSVNARVAAAIANRRDVREKLASKGITIPDDTWFVGALHDTTRDEIEFYDLKDLPVALAGEHQQLSRVFNTALQRNAVERARRFDLINHRASAVNVHTKVKRRAVSLFEPRPEWNHATNALCIVGRREITTKLFLDRRAFLQSYDCLSDPEGKTLAGILGAITPVCGGINLEYYFSRVDNSRLGAGSKLPHNVMGFIGVANGMEGDLRTGLPFQMVNIHDPLRLMMVVEQTPEALMKALSSNPAVLEWYANEWIVLVAVHPETKELFRFQQGEFVKYTSTCEQIPETTSIQDLVMNHTGNIPVYQIK